MTWNFRLPRALLLAAVLAAPACSGDAPVEPASPARAYLEQMVGIMEQRSINRLKIDWKSFRATVLADAAGAQSIPDTYPAIRTALRLLGDGHSFYRPVTGSAISVPTRTCASASFSRPALPADIGYVRVGSFSGTAAQATAFARAIQDSIRANDREDLAGWIVDLRRNGGGNMWPMLAGVGPILGEGVVGYFIDPLGAETAWEYRDGTARSGGSVTQRVDAPYRLRRERPRVAVLTDNLVASSGEAVAIAFRQRAGARSFGTATCGLSTANATVPLSDGATLYLTVSVMADRTRVRYGDSVAPDETVADAGQAVQRAVAWLQSGT